MRNGGVIEQQLAFGVPPCRQAQLAVFVSQEDVTTLGPGELQGHVEKRQQDFIQHAGSVQLACGFEEDSQLLEIGDFVRNLDARNLTEKIARRIGGDVLRMKNRVNRVTGAKLEAVVALELPTLHAFAIDERAVLAALVLHEELSVFRKKKGMVARDPGICNRQVFFHLAANTERSVIEVEGTLLAAVNKNQAGKDTGADTGNWADDGLASH